MPRMSTEYEHKNMTMMRIERTPSRLWQYTYFYDMKEGDYENAHRKDLILNWLWGWEPGFKQSKLKLGFWILGMVLGGFIFYPLKNILKIFVEWIPLFIFTHLRDLASACNSYLKNAQNQNRFLRALAHGGRVFFAVLAFPIGVLHFLTRSVLSPLMGIVEAVLVGFQSGGGAQLAGAFGFGRFLLSAGLIAALCAILSPGGIPAAINAAIAAPSAVGMILGIAGAMAALGATTLTTFNGPLSVGNAWDIGIEAAGQAAACEHEDQPVSERTGVNVAHPTMIAARLRRFGAPPLVVEKKTVVLAAPTASAEEIEAISNQLTAKIHYDFNVLQSHSGFSGYPKEKLFTSVLIAETVAYVLSYQKDTQEGDLTEREFQYLTKAILETVSDDFKIDAIKEGIQSLNKLYKNKNFELSPQGQLFISKLIEKQEKIGVDNTHENEGVRTGAGFFARPVYGQPYSCPGFDSTGFRIYSLKERR